MKHFNFGNAGFYGSVRSNGATPSRFDIYVHDTPSCGALRLHWGLNIVTPFGLLADDST